MSTKHQIKLYDEQLKNFGNYAVIIKDVKQFLKKIENSNKKFGYGVIGYKNNNSERQVEVFKSPIKIKILKYSSQK